jgi:hypothetical protein
LHNDRKFPYVITVFSAPRYAARYNNKAAFLQVLSKMEDVHLNFIQYDAAEHSQKKRPAVQTFAHDLVMSRDGRKTFDVCF